MSNNDKDKGCKQNVNLNNQQSAEYKGWLLPDRAKQADQSIPNVLT